MSGGQAGGEAADLGRRAPRGHCLCPSTHNAPGQAWRPRLRTGNGAVEEEEEGAREEGAPGLLRAGGSYQGDKRSSLLRRPWAAGGAALPRQEQPSPPGWAEPPFCVFREATGGAELEAALLAPVSCQSHARLFCPGSMSCSARGTSEGRWWGHQEACRLHAQAPLRSCPRGPSACTAQPAARREGRLVALAAPPRAAASRGWASSSLFLRQAPSPPPPDTSPTTAGSCPRGLWDPSAPPLCLPVPEG